MPLGPRRDILLDDNGNQIISGSDFLFAEDIQAVKDQGVSCRVGLWLGEVWYNSLLGVDYFGQILIANPNELIVKSLISQAVASTPDVTQVTTTGYTFDPSDQHATVSYAAVSTWGTVEGSS